MIGLHFSTRALVLWLTLLPWGALSQLSAHELETLFAGLYGSEDHTEATVEKRVPLSTNDPTTTPLIDLQVYAPPATPNGGTKCTVQLLQHSFGVDSYGKPAVVKYTPPVDPACGRLGEWAVIALNVTSYSIGTQYDRLSAIFLSHVEIMRHSSVEPTKTGTRWSIVKDVTYYAPLFSREGELMFEFSNIIAPELLLDGVFDVTVEATFYAPTTKFKTPRTSDLIIPLSNLSPASANYFSISDDAGAVTNITLPRNTTQAFVEIYGSGNGAEEFWYTNTPDEFLTHFPPSTGLIGKGPFREIQVWVEDKLAGVVWPFPVFYTGGVCPTMWRPLSAYGTFDQPSYFVDVTPLLPLILSKEAPTAITLRVLGQGKNPSINANWTNTTGQIKEYVVGDLDIQTDGSAGSNDTTVWTHVRAARSLRISSELWTAEGKQTVSFEQNLHYTNDAFYTQQGWVQSVNQTTTGTTASKHGSRQVFRDAFSYPLKLSSDYSKYTWEFGGYGAQVNQTYERALLHPTSFYRAIQSVQHARGDVGMDDWPGLRHAINGSGFTDQTFAYVDDRSNTYFRKIAAKNDGWLRDKVWGNRGSANPPVPDEQIWPDGGPGFRRDLGGRNVELH